MQLSALPASLLLLLLLHLHSAHAYLYCHFTTGSACNGTQSVDFSVYDSGCFRATGAYMQCHGDAAGYFNLVQSPDNGDNCYCQNHCGEFSYTVFDEPSGCYDLKALGFNPDYDTYRFVGGFENECGANNCGLDEIGVAPLIGY